MENVRSSRCLTPLLGAAPRTSSPRSDGGSATPPARETEFRAALPAHEVDVQGLDVLGLGGWPLGVERARRRASERPQGGDAQPPHDVAEHDRAGDRHPPGHAATVAARLRGPDGRTDRGAIVLGYVVWRLGISTLRALAGPAPGTLDTERPPPSPRTSRPWTSTSCAGSAARSSRSPAWGSCRSPVTAGRRCTSSSAQERCEATGGPNVFHRSAPRYPQGYPQPSVEEAATSRRRCRRNLPPGPPGRAT